jgi:hypothetical protein
MVEANDPVQLAVRQLEKPLCLSVSIVFQPGCPQNGIVEGHRDPELSVRKAARSDAG